MYLKKFGDRYGGERLERARDLYEKVLSSVPKEVRDINLNFCYFFIYNLKLKTSKAKYFI